MESLLSSLTVYMMIGIVVVVGVSQLNRLIGSILGIAFWLSVAVIGSTAYDKGGGIKLVSFEFSRTGFLVLCAVFIGFNCLSLYKALKNRSIYQQRRGARISDSDEE